MLEEINGHIRRQQALSSRLLNPEWIKHTVQLLSTSSNAPNTTKTNNKNNSPTTGSSSSLQDKEQILYTEIESVIKSVIQEVNEEMKQTNTLPDIRLPYTENLQSIRNKENPLLNNTNMIAKTITTNDNNNNSALTQSVSTKPVTKEQIKGDHATTDQTIAKTPLPKRSLI